ncbi:MAG: LLM class flavin-dependent oxidoreductase [Chloroflexi bacterium]|nr:LLM class flavin-dependent oxidoreductase [Chloroflexota bacterium]
MKFHWFNLMPWPYLPDDFREKHRSVWVDVDSRLYDPVKGHRVYNDYLDMLEFAADLGYDGIGVNEHHQNAYGMMPSPQLMAATLARRTQDVSILLLGQSIAYYNPPTRVAEEMAMLDVMSGGRLISGFPVGTSMDGNYAVGTNPATLREQYQEAHDLIKKAWAEPDVFTWNGKYHKLRYVNIWPRPIQSPSPPIWIPGGGSIETWDFCAANNYNYSYLSFSGYLRAEQLMKGFWQRMEELGQEFNPYQGAFAQQICVAENMAEAQRLYEPHVRYFFERCLHVYPGFADAPGYRTEATMRAGLMSQVSGQAGGSAVAHELSWDELVKRGFILAGSPDDVAEQAEQMSEKLRVGHIVCLLHMGDMPLDKTLYNTEMFATRVMPRLRPLWSEYEDKWSPHPLPKDDMATPRAVPGRRLEPGKFLQPAPAGTAGGGA